MRFSNKNILLISPQPWEHIFVSKHHYAIYLGKMGNTVYFLNPPSSAYAIEKTNFDNVFSLSYSGFLPGFRFLPSILQRRYMRSVISKLEQVAGTRFDVVWSFDNSVFFDFSAFCKKILKISHIVDLNQDFHFSTAARTADLCISTNRSIVDRFREYNPCAYYVGHGFADYDFAVKGGIVLPGLNKLKIGYAGNLDIPYFDWPLLERLVDDNPFIDFIVAGPWSKNQSNSRLLKKHNIFFIGVLDSKQLNSFYSQMDILVLCYMADRFRTQVANPHKVIEYLASGKMVCSTFTAEYAALAKDGILLMSDKNDDFPALLSNSINNLSYWNSQDMANKRRSFALRHTYDKQIEIIEALAREWEAGGQSDKLAQG